MDITYNNKTKVISRKNENYILRVGGIGQLMWKSMIRNGNSTSQIDAQTGKTNTHYEVFQKSIRAAIQIRKLGIKPGDIISICSHNHLNSCVPFIAAQFLGAVVAPIDPTIAPEDIKYLLNLVKPRMIFISESCEAWIEDVTDGMIDLKIVTFGDGSRFINFNIFLVEDEEDIEPYFVEDGNVDALILFSSGTTGLPKGICLSHNFWMLNCCNFSNNTSPFQDIDFPSRHTIKFDSIVYLSYTSLYWISSVLSVILCITDNHCRLLCEEFNADLFWNYIEKYKVQLAMLAPTQAIRCLKAKPKNLVPQSLKSLSIGGSSISPIYLDKIREALPTVTVGVSYGITEIGICICPSPADKDKPYTVGSPVYNFDYKIVDPDTGCPLGYNEVGELRIRSPYPMNGYYNKNFADCFDDEGFLKTGDMLYYDRDFSFYITDRIKEMFKYLSWHIVPAKLEAVLERHPDVQFAVVVGIPHAEDDNHATGVVLLNENAEATSTELTKFVNSLVDERNWLHGGVKVVKSIPLTPSGKIMRRKLRDMIINGEI